MTVSTLDTVLTLSALALGGVAVSLAGPLLIYFGTWRSKTPNLLPAFITGVVAALLCLAIVDATPWLFSPEPGSHGVSIQLQGWLDFYVAGLLWALRIIAAMLLLTTIAGVLVFSRRAIGALYSWLTGYSDKTCANFDVNRAKALRRSWRQRSAERRFARSLTSDLLGPATRKKCGTISWTRDPAFVDLATEFVMTPAADYYSISGYDIEDHIDRAEQRPEICSVEVLSFDECDHGPVPPSRSETTFIVRWNGEYLSRPLTMAVPTDRTGALFFGRWPLRARARRWASGPAGAAVIVGAAMALLVLAGASLGTPPRQQPTPDTLALPQTSAPPRPVSHLLQADQQGGEACSLRRIHPSAPSDDPCGHAGIDGDRYFFTFDDTKVITAVAVNPVTIKPDRVVRQVIWLFNGDPDNGDPATEHVQNIEPMAASIELRLDHGVRASTVTMIVSDTMPRFGAAASQPAQGPGAITLIGYDTPDPRSGAGHSLGDAAPAGQDNGRRPGS